MKKQVTITLIAVLVIPILSLAQGVRVSYFSPRSLYVYAMGSCMLDFPSNCWSISQGIEERSSAFAPMVGIGYTVINVKDRSLVNLEFDYSSADFEFSSHRRRIEYYTFMTNFEYRLFPENFMSLYVGVGVAAIDYTDNPEILAPDDYVYPYDDVEFTMALNLGFKMALSNRIQLRAEFRYYWDNYSDEDFYYILDGYFTEYFYYEYGQRFGIALSFGAEYRF